MIWLALPPPVVSKSAPHGSLSRLIHEGPSAYSCLVVLPDMSIGCFYEGGTEHRREKLTFARFTLEWLTGNADRLR